MNSHGTTKRAFTDLSAFKDDCRHYHHRLPANRLVPSFRRPPGGNIGSHRPKEVKYSGARWYVLSACLFRPFPNLSHNELKDDCAGKNEEIPTKSNRHRTESHHDGTLSGSHPSPRQRPHLDQTSSFLPSLIPRNTDKTQELPTTSS